MEDKVFQAALAGLLHDIGKFRQRADRKGCHTELGVELFRNEFKSLLPQDWLEDISDTVLNHHHDQASKEIVQVVSVADWLASAEQMTGQPNQPVSQNTPLMPITAQVLLDKPEAEQEWNLPIKELSLNGNGSQGNHPLFPQQNQTINDSDYVDLWQKFEKELQSFPGPVSLSSHFAGVMSILRKYTTQIPSVTAINGEKGHVLPDVSLYDHLKITAAISACLVRLPVNHINELYHKKWLEVLQDNRPIACLLRADLSGIQSFIYRITEPERERGFRSTAKRLRGRSFYISLLTEVVADWLLRELGMIPANALFIGGGRFDLLIPTDAATQNRLAELEKTLQNWLLKEFHGVLGVEFATTTLKPADFKAMELVNESLDEKLANIKRQKFNSALSKQFFQVQALKHVCAVCGLTPLKSAPSDDQTCDLCKLHRDIGQLLPTTRYIARLYHSKPDRFKKLERHIIEFGDPINIRVGLLKDADEVQLLLNEGGQEGVETAVFSLNDNPTPQVSWPDRAAPAQFYLANAAPLAGSEVYEFDKIAELSAGSQLLGILKADVDHLGLLFSLGLEPLTFSRLATLSHAFDRFFGGYLNTLCRRITAEWKRQRDKKGQSYPPSLESLFYIVYAGGDDLLIIGPWDQTIELAKCLYADFKAYTCQNPNITLSAGITLVKPHFPVQRFAELVSEALDTAKNAGRDRITVFDQTVLWSDYGSATSFDKLLKLADNLLEKVEQKQMPRTLVHDLGRLAERKYKGRDGVEKPLITPELLYLLTRRLPKEVRDELKRPILDALEAIHIPVSYVSLITRKE